jgi:hypothetical protein
MRAQDELRPAARRRMRQEIWHAQMATVIAAPSVRSEPTKRPQKARLLTAALTRNADVRRHQPARPAVAASRSRRRAHDRVSIIRPASLLSSFEVRARQGSHQLRPDEAFQELMHHRQWPVCYDGSASGERQYHTHRSADRSREAMQVRARLK